MCLTYTINVYERCCQLHLKCACEYVLCIAWLHQNTQYLCESPFLTVLSLYIFYFFFFGISHVQLTQQVLFFSPIESQSHIKKINFFVASNFYDNEFLFFFATNSSFQSLCLDAYHRKVGALMIKPKKMFASIIIIRRHAIMVLRSV